jgi:hypothetical protein
MECNPLAPDGEPWLASCEVVRLKKTDSIADLGYRQYQVRYFELAFATFVSPSIESKWECYRDVPPLEQVSNDTNCTAATKRGLQFLNPSNFS